MAFPAVTVYYLPTCPSCKAAKDYLTSHRVPFTAVDVSSPESMEKLRAKTGTMATPVLVVGGEQVIGWDRDKVKSLLGL